jgi:hypothetical protein
MVGYHILRVATRYKTKLNKFNLSTQIKRAIEVYYDNMVIFWYECRIPWYKRDFRKLRR